MKKNWGNTFFFLNKPINKLRNVEVINLLNTHALTNGLTREPTIYTIYYSERLFPKMKDYNNAVINV